MRRSSDNDPPWLPLGLDGPYSSMSQRGRFCNRARYGSKIEGRPFPSAVERDDNKVVTTVMGMVVVVVVVVMRRGQRNFGEGRMDARPVHTSSIRLGRTRVHNLRGRGRKPADQASRQPNDESACAIRERAWEEKERR